MKICTIKTFAIALLAAATAPLTLAAKTGDRFESDGIFYEVLSEQELTVEVARGEYLYDEEEGETYSYTGDIVIPPTVEYDGKTYTVTAIGDFAFCMWDFPAGGSDNYFHHEPNILGEGISSISIPSTVTSIGLHAFLGCVKLTSIIIPESVTEIDDSAFAYCSSLSDVNLPSSLQVISGNMFEECSSLEHIDIPASVTYIGYQAFCGCSSLKELTIPESVTTISDMAFYFCTSLTSINIPAALTSIEETAFNNCSSIENFIVDAGNTALLSLDGVVYDREMTALLHFPAARTGSFTIPENVTMIGNYSFSYCQNLEEIIIPESVTAIGWGAFQGCKSLKSMTIPQNVASIEFHAFSGCSSLEQVLVPQMITSIKDGCFSYCSNLQTILIPESVTSIERFAFEECTSLTSINLPDGLTTIGDRAFLNCSSLKEIHFPTSLKDVTYLPFTSCTGFTDVYCYWEEPLYFNPDFPECVYKNATLHVPESSFIKYINCNPWSRFHNYAPMAGIDDIKACDFRVKAIDGCIIVEGAEDAGAAEIRVTDLSGRTVYAGRDTHIGPLPQGLYIVTAGPATLKIRL